jgi:hypothetical protein
MAFISRARPGLGYDYAAEMQWPHCISIAAEAENFVLGKCKSNGVLIRLRGNLSSPPGIGVRLNNPGRSYTLAVNGWTVFVGSVNPLVGERLLVRPSLD